MIYMDRELLHKSIVEKTQLSFSRSGGHGGQNVNKVNTKVHATIAVAELDGLSSGEVGLIKQRLSHMINNEGCIVIAAQDERTQERNREIALARLEQKICDAAKFRKPRRATKPTKASKEKRLLSKRMRSLSKQNRQKISAE